MTLFGALGFTTPWLLLGLLALPVLWLILRAIPPAPLRRMFPGVVLLLGLRDDEQVSDRTPWWLLLLRMLAVAALIIGLAGPVLNPEQDRAAGSGPLLVLLDGSWAGADDWTAKTRAIEAELAEAGRQGRTVAIARLTTPEAPVFQSATAWTGRLAGLAPQPWQPDAEDMAEFAAALPEGGFDTLWVSDGLAREGRDDLLATLEDRGAVRVLQSPETVLALEPARIEEGAIALTARRASPGPAREIAIAATPRVFLADTAAIEALATELRRLPQIASEAGSFEELPEEIRTLYKLEEGDLAVLADQIRPSGELAASWSYNVSRLMDELAQ
ncbi:MAG: BatA domain-containing protein, partial [Paracoccaceae bacterium]